MFEPAVRESLEDAGCAGRRPTRVEAELADGLLCEVLVGILEDPNIAPWSELAAEPVQCLDDR